MLVYTLIFKLNLGATQTLVKGMLEVCQLARDPDSEHDRVWVMVANIWWLMWARKLSRDVFTLVFDCHEFAEEFSAYLSCLYE